ncbi:hypothetical protein DICPUDRAFT_154923 [Dictyostelium purpureum]|uniref:DUF6748 domain-containing protein n=1 Tax=Dictyostelium purpureum TaxID=5786 RepID=F0ZSL7_DICPU|nr:uncharacterized protein DICPUDRAFT_154923 [Dictyostelium purpureum]EGC33069.1 hypothetical protein DICPUDRAFT_154923 [Dictyostelium purpureum]|eukprot:XP_003290419.1 hypothetical protein DICPUDRAFT_154923 [Dictyostelium purpureum]
MFYIILSLFVLFVSCYGAESSATINNYYYKLSYRNIQCITVPCPQYEVQKINTNNGAIVVENIVFPNGLEQNFLTLSEADTVIFYGSLIANRNGYNMNDFKVVKAYKRLPQPNVSTSTDKYYMIGDNGVRCITTPCFSIDAALLNTATSTAVQDIYEPYSTNVNLFDGSWLSAKLFNDETQRYIGLGSIDSTGKIVLSSVYVRLPDPSKPCPSFPLLKCADGFTTVYERDLNRCLTNPTCTTQSGACALYVPTCPTGYRLASYPGGNFGCPVYNCDSIYISETY